MEKVLSNIDIPNERIEAFDGKENLTQYITCKR